MWKATPAVLVICSFSALMKNVPNVNGATLQEAKTLRADLLNGYDRSVRPIVNQSEYINVSIGLGMIALQEFDEVLEKFSFVGVFQLSWTDESLQWDASNYSGIDQVMMGYKDVWVPEVILTNPSEKLESFGDDWQMIRYNNYGTAFWYPADLIKATCAINAYYFPFDIQECTLEVYVWAYFAMEVKLQSIGDNVDTTFMSEHGSWKLKETKATAEIVGWSSKGSFVFRFERKSQYVIINIVLPIMFLCLLNVLVFILPAESGERISYSITVLLSIAVFMTIVSDTLPKTSEPLPLISFFLMMNLINSALITTATLLNLRLFHKDSNSPVPSWLVRIYKRLSICCSTKCNRKTGQATEAHEKDLQTPVTEMKIESINKVAPFEPHSYGKNDSQSSESQVTWRDVSIFVDIILLIGSASFVLLSFVIFLLITATAS